MLRPAILAFICGMTYNGVAEAKFYTNVFVYQKGGGGALLKAALNFSGKAFNTDSECLSERDRIKWTLFKENPDSISILSSIFQENYQGQERYVWLFCTDTDDKALLNANLPTRFDEDEVDPYKSMISSSNFQNRPPRPYIAPVASPPSISTSSRQIQQQEYDEIEEDYPAENDEQARFKRDFEIYNKMIDAIPEQKKWEASCFHFPQDCERAGMPNGHPAANAHRETVERDRMNAIRSRGR